MENKILEFIKKNKKVKVAQMVTSFGISRQYLNRFLQKLVQSNKIIKIGKGPAVEYILYNSQNIKKIKENIREKTYTLHLKKPFLGEDYVWKKVLDEYVSFLSPSKNAFKILSFAFTEMLNNSLEHSKTNKIDIVAKKVGPKFFCSIRDFGIGAFANVKDKFGFQTEFDAINFILKGKQTTDPKNHTGQGVFFTSKIVDEFVLQSHELKLKINNSNDEYGVEKEKNISGTAIEFSLNLHSKKDIGKIFGKFTDKEFVFDKTEIKIKLYELQTDFVSRSMAKRLLMGLEKFTVILLDFEGVDFIGQGFADEIFRVWQRQHPQIKIAYENVSKDILFMINYAKNNGS